MLKFQIRKAEDGKLRLFRLQGETWFPVYLVGKAEVTEEDLRELVVKTHPGEVDIEVVETAVEPTGGAA